MPTAFPPEFLHDVVAVARKDDAPIAQVAKDFEISASCLQRWLKIADIDEGVRPGTTTESVELERLADEGVLADRRTAQRSPVA